MAEIVQLRISLLDVEPEVWRRILVMGDLRLNELHAVIQGVMGWQNEHLHAFTIGEDRYEQQMDDGFDFGPPGKDEALYRFDKLVRVGADALYEYDFGDGWEHRIVRERLTRPVPEVFFFAHCVEGANACPPEDVGGPPGYAEYLEALSAGRGDAYKEALAWRGAFDPSAFSASQATQAAIASCLLAHFRGDGFDWL